MRAAVYCIVTAHHLYVHVPFCARRCSYCDFAIAVRREVPVDDYLRCLRLELESVTEGVRQGGQLDTLYFGGGTPSLIGPGGIQRLVDLVADFFSISPDAEITLEANPDDVSVESARRWRAAGINRLSLGLQSFDEAVLEWMHRTHTAAQGRDAVFAARGAGFENISVDLIFSLPTELARSWESDLETALDLEPSHVSLYGLTIEPATPLARWEERGTVRPAGDDSYADEFLLADRMATSRGFSHYEVSNFARPGMESRHNSAYWSGAAYLGVGPSAHSFDGATRAWNVAPYSEWTRRLIAGKNAIEGSEFLTAANRAAERTYLGLRTSGGVASSAAGVGKARKWSDAGWARIDRDVVRLTPEGWLRLDALAAGLTAL